MMSMNTINLLLFKVNTGSAEEYYAIDVDKVYEIRVVEKITAIPDARIITGIMNLRGKIISVVDINDLLGFDYKGDVSKRKILIASVNNTTLGLIVDDVEQVAKITDGSIDYNAAILDNIPYIKGIIKMNDRLVIYLDIDKLFNNGGMLQQ
jgi:purine-binding chemotaxis protein CheW